MNKNYIDLHTHSTASDGTFTPTELVDEARSTQLSAIALTDHDTVSGLDEFMTYGSNFQDLITIPGCELSVSFSNREAHIVGLFIDRTSEPFLEFLSKIRDNRNKRNDLILMKLQKNGYDISKAELEEVSTGESIGRPHFAKVLVKKGYFKQKQDVFDTILKRGRSCYVARTLPSPEEAISSIHAAGGLAIWAHPIYRAKNERSFVKKSLQHLMQFGLDGIESHYPLFTQYQHAIIKELANEYNLLESGGSDFHGTNLKNVNLGTGKNNLAIPFDIYEKMIDRLNTEI